MRHEAMLAALDRGGLVEPGMFGPHVAELGDVERFLDDLEREPLF